MIIELSQDQLSAAMAYAEGVLRDIVPDLEGWPIYVDTPSRSSGAVRCTDAAGFTSFNHDLGMKPELEAQGKWKGRGLAATVINSIRVPESLAQFGASAAKVQFTRTIWHEACHWLEHVAKWERHEATAQTQASRASDYRETLQREEVSAPYPQAKLIPMALHGHRFFRIAGHMAFRLRWKGLDPSSIASPDVFSLPPFEQFIAATEDEARAMRWDSFADVLKTPPSKPFVNLWRSSIDAWRKAQGPLTVELARAMFAYSDDLYFGEVLT